jgi:Mg-chelatase subunit ChlD
VEWSAPELVTIGDLRRAILNGGDVSSFADAYSQALGGCPIPVVSQFDTALTLPPPELLLGQVDSRFATPMAPGDSGPPVGEALAAALEVKAVARPLYLPGGGDNLSSIIAEFRPDLIGLDCSPAEMGAHIPYAFSMACAVGVPAQFEIVHGPSVEARFNGRFHPANAGVSALLEGWLRRIPLLPIGRPLSACAAGASEGPPYVASRTIDAARFGAILGRRVRLLTIIDPERHESVLQVTASLLQGRESDLYAPAEVDPESGQSFIIGECLSTTDENLEPTPELTTEAQQRFRAEFDRMVRDLSTRQLTATEAVDLITRIVGRTRRHRDIVRGASVRGSIAFDEILGGLSVLNGGLTRENVMKAALIALPPRISARQSGNDAAVIGDITKEVLYGIRFSPEDDGPTPTAAEGLSSDDIMSIADTSRPTHRLAELDSDDAQSFAVVPEMPKEAESTASVRDLNLPPNARRDQYAAIKKAIMQLIGDLDDQLREGKITPGEYEHHKAGLMARLEKAAGAQLSMSNREMATTIMEMMDAQDGQWNSEISLGRMRVYYHVKGTCEGRAVSPLKQDYHALKWLLDDLKQQQVLKATGDAAEFTLTGFALDSLLKYLVDPHGVRASAPRTSATGIEFSTYRAHEVRRYSPGDTFRDISVRHTLREIVRKKKGLTDVTSADLRVFLKERRRPQVDVVFCIDVSGSMGFRQKLVYARLVAAGLVESAFHEGNRAGVVAFNDYGQTTVPLTGQDRDSLFNGIAGLTPRGNTNIGDGIRAARDLLLRDHRRNRKQIILVSDGQASAMSATAFAQLSPAKGRDLTEDAAVYETSRTAAAGVQLSVVYIAGTGETDDSFVRNLARAGRGTVRRLGGLADIRTMLRR